ncbi:MAG: PQQ-binding-like beta-propeller repeat protein, partial [Propionibacteriaceae bacterium]|nr:PQQ-binding-like beta-propeller repeat protein [Propionibacteriaceae bacterium]
GLPGGRAAELVGRDGQTAVFSGGGVLEQREWAHLYGSEAFSGPYEFFMAMSYEGSMSMDEALATNWIRHTTTSQTGDQSHWLYSIDERGLHTQVAVSSELSVAFLPARLDVPADVHPGMTWTSEGTMHVLSGGSFGYTSEAVAEQADEHGQGCLRIRHVDQVDQIGELDQNLVWCPERGVVVDGDYTLTDLPPAPRTPVEPLAWDPQHWNLTEPTAMQYEDGFLSVSPLSEPLGVAGRAAVLTTSQDLVSFDNEWLYRAVSRPGGSLVAATQAQDLTLLASSRRTITALDERYWRRWQVSVSDVVVQVVPAGPDHFVSVTSSGTVSLRTLDDGTVRWEHTYPGAADFRVTVHGERVFVMSGLKQATVLNLADGATVGTADLPDQAIQLGGGDDLLVVVGNNGRIFAFEHDGTPRWTSEIGGNRLQGHFAFTDTEIIFGDPARTWGLNPATGDVNWYRELPVERLLTDGRYVVAYAQTHLTVLRGGGAVVHTWPLSSEYAVSVFYCRALPDGVICIDGVGRLTQVGP